MKQKGPKKNNNIIQTVGHPGPLSFLRNENV